MIDIEIHDETSPLEIVILGIGESFDSKVSNNPKTLHHRLNNTFPKEEDVLTEIKTFENVLASNGVTVLRPTTIYNKEQIFTRDIGFVVGDKFIISNMAKESRQTEIIGIQHIIDQIDQTKIIQPPDEVNIEGGDVILWKDYIFVGKSDRTNDAAYHFLRETFPEKKVEQLELVTSDDYRKNVLHLDCAFQPVGENYAIIYPEGFTNKPQVIYDCFGDKNIIIVSSEQAFRMFPNVFSISKKKVVIEQSFIELKEVLLQKGFDVVEVKYNEVSKLSGLLRCSTLPLKRTY